MLEQRSRNGEVCHVCHADGCQPRPGTDSREILLLAGTRPEGIKLAPLALRLRCSDRFIASIIDTGQHPGRVDEALAPFGLAPVARATLQRASGTLAELCAGLIGAVDAMLVDRQPAAVVVQGDTLTALAGGLVGFWRRVPVVHLEAGLRTHDLAAPFPEEANRAMLARVARLHLAPTERARRNLLAEGVRGDDVVVTGNTIVDAVQHLISTGAATPPAFVDQSRSLVVATSHRRENWGERFIDVCAALRQLARRNPQVQVVMVAHPNPALASALRTLLPESSGVLVVPPLPYPEMLGLLNRAALVVTDSGGIQEEAATLGVPLLVTRDTTERPEAIACGIGAVVGTDPDRILAEAEARLSAPAPAAPTTAPFGDGHAARRCVEAIAAMLEAPAPDGDPSVRLRPGPLLPIV
jgi:UDP-N-acetylglucosamine 2-epimerase (non-hydrolysing)